MQEPKNGHEGRKARNPAHSSDGRWWSSRRRRNGRRRVARPPDGYQRVNTSESGELEKARLVWPMNKEPAT